MKQIYTCSYVSGSGKEYGNGLWEKKETEKMIIFKRIEESFYQTGWELLKLHKDKTKNKHPFEYWEDGSYTVYPEQCGTPHIFEKIKGIKINE